MNRFIYLWVSLFFVHTLAENCDKYGIRLYEDMACEAKSSGGPCPEKYDCKLTPPKPNQCVVRGKIYNKGDHIDEDRTGHTCEFGCSCSLPTVTCPQWGCADWAGVPPLPSEDCYREYSLDGCCSKGIQCPPLNDTTTCSVDGIEYKAGQKMFPKDSCYACLCQKGFNGKFEAPFCKRRGCDAQVKYQTEIQKSCAAVYLKQNSDGEAKCCPTMWACPDGSEVIKSGGNKSNLSCRFGDKTLQIGDIFEKNIQVSLVREKKVTCECKIPPLVMCYDA